MNIYTQRGDKVVFTGEHGRDWEIEEAKEHFYVGQVLTVESVEVGKWNTLVKLEESCEVFNSVLFRDATEEDLVRTTYDFEVDQDSIKVGTKLIIKTRKELLQCGFERKHGALQLDGGLYVNDAMVAMGGKEVTVSHIIYKDSYGRVRFSLEEDDRLWEWDYRMFNPVTKDVEDVEDTVEVEEDVEVFPEIPVPEESVQFTSAESEKLLKYLKGYDAGFRQAMKLMGVEV